MLQVLLNRKLGRWLIKSPWEIEDLLTATIFGACEYAGIEGWRYALHPFLSKAIYKSEHQPNAKTQLLLPDKNAVTKVEYQFWPWFDRRDAKASSASMPVPIGSMIASVDGASPEVIITLHTKDKIYVLLIEVKLNIGKSSGPAQDVNRISDQLAKYSRHLQEYAKRNSNHSLGVIYITPSTAYPTDEIAESRLELKKVGQSAPSIYWISWRHFVSAVEKACQTHDSFPKILIDVITLLRDGWGLVYEEMKGWPTPPSLPEITKFNSMLLWRDYCFLPECKQNFDTYGIQIPHRGSSELVAHIRWPSPTSPIAWNLNIQYKWRNF